jgi:hypothetical protein
MDRLLPMLLNVTKENNVFVPKEEAFLVWISIAYSNLNSAWPLSTHQILWDYLQCIVRLASSSNSKLSLIKKRILGIQDISSVID